MRVLITTLLSLLPALGGCASVEPGPELLVISSLFYEAAFDAADAAVRAESMPPTLRDRRGGVIETEPRIAASVFEPWRGDNTTPEQAWESTYSYQRRRLRVEFVPEGIDLETRDEGAPLHDPDVIGLDSPLRDLTGYEGRIEVRVWAYLERSQTFGVRRSTWTATGRRQMRIIDTGAGTASPVPPTEWERTHSIVAERRGVIAPSYWIPVSRDPVFERKVLAAIQRRLDESG